MEILNNTYLKFIDFIDVSNWSVQYLKGTAFSYNKNFEFVKIGDFLTRNKTQVDIEDGKEYKRVTIKMNNNGVFLRDIEKGENIGTKKQFLVKKGQFLLSKIDARGGAFGVIPDEVDGAIITGNFWTFDVDYSKVNPHFLSNLVTTKEFLLFCENASNGTTNRHYLQENSFLNVKIPLPNLTEQNRIVQEYNAKIKNSLNAEIKAGELEKEVENYLMEELGINLIKTEKIINLKTFKLIDFFDTEKWGTKYLLNGLDLGKILKSSIFQMYKLKDLLEINPQTSFDKSLNISFIPMRYVSDEYGEIINKDIVNGSESNGYTKFKEGDLIWSRITPCMQNGKSAIVKELENGIGCGSTEYHVLRNNNEKLNLEYVYIILRLKRILKYAMNYFTGSAGQQRVPKEFLEDLQIPLPPLGIQEKIVKHIGDLKEEIKSLKKLSDILKESAKVEFEKEIFS